MKKVYFRADASAEFGFGHFIRSLALADMLKDEFDCKFFTQQPTKFQIVEMEKVCPYVILPADDSKYDIFLRYIEGDEIVLLDNYFYSADYEKNLKEKGCKVISLGDNTRHYYADAVVNFTKLQSNDFSVESYTRMCLGLDWTILRTPFYSLHNNLRSNIVICIGGTDQYGYSEYFATAISEAYPMSNIQIIATDRIGEERIKGLQNSRYQLLLNLTANQMAETFSKAKVAIVSASSIAIEALSQGANVIAGYYVENQKNIYRTLKEDGYIWGVGDFLEERCISIILDAIKVIKNDECKIPFCPHNAIDNYKTLFHTL